MGVTPEAHQRAVGCQFLVEARAAHHTSPDTVLVCARRAHPGYRPGARLAVALLKTKLLEAVSACAWVARGAWPRAAPPIRAQPRGAAARWVAALGVGECPRVAVWPDLAAFALFENKAAKLLDRELGIIEYETVVDVVGEQRRNVDVAAARRHDAQIVVAEPHRRAGHGLVVLQEGLPGPVTGVWTDPVSEPRMATIYVRAFEVDVLHDAGGRGGRRLEAEADAVVERAADRLGAGQRHVLPRGHIAAVGQAARVTAARGQPARDRREGVGDCDACGGVGPPLRRVGATTDRAADGPDDTRFESFFAHVY